jgi:hypothetical protein
MSRGSSMPRRSSMLREEHAEGGSMPTGSSMLRGAVCSGEQHADREQYAKVEQHARGSSMLGGAATPHTYSSVILL